MTQDEALDIFHKTGALLKGHFILRSGLRSREFFQCAAALQQMPVVERLGQGLADKVRELDIATVVAPAMGGLVIGQEVARQLGVRFVFLEKEDVVTRGGRADETVNIITQEGAELIALAVLVDRSNGKYKPKIPFYSLLTMNVKTYDPEDLPEDLKSITPIKPGSK